MLSILDKSKIMSFGKEFIGGKYQFVLFTQFCSRKVLFIVFKCIHSDIVCEIYVHSGGFKDRCHIAVYTNAKIYTPSVPTITDNLIYTFPRVINLSKMNNDIAVRKQYTVL